MSSTTQRYPFATASGDSIPLDVVKPSGLIVKSFLSSGATGNIALPADVEAIGLLASEDCIVRFGAAASVPADGVNLSNAIYVPAGMHIIAAPPADTFSAIGHTANGTLIVQLIAKWAGLSLDTQTTRT